MKRSLALLLTLALLIGMTSGMAATATAENAPIELILATNVLNNGFPATIAEDWMHDKILADTGISLVVTLVDDYYTAMNARIAGGNIPDLLWADPDNMRTYAKEGVLLNLDAYKDKELAGLMAWIGSTNVSPYLYQKQLYAIPKNYVNAIDYININVRQDWLDALNLQIPTNVQELYDVAYAFVHNDPDKNGAADTFGLSGNKGFYAFDTIVNSFDTALGNHIILRDGKVTNALLQPGMVDALTWCKKFNDDGLMDPDSYTTTGSNKAMAGQVGLLTMGWHAMYKQAYRDQIAEVNKDAKWTVFGPLASEVGAEPCLVALDECASLGAYCVSADISDDKLAAIFRLVDYMISPEGANLVYYGLEGTHWAYDEAGAIKMTERATEANFTPTYQLFGRNEEDYLNVKFPEAKVEFYHAMDINRFVVYNSLIEEPENVYLNDLNDYVNNQLLAFIYGDRPITEYDAFIKELYDSFAFGTYMDAAAEQMAANGYTK